MSEFNDWKLPGLTSKYLASREEFVCANQDCTFYICHQCFSGDLSSKLNFDNCPKCLNPKVIGFDHIEGQKDIKWHRFISLIVG